MEITKGKIIDYLTLILAVIGVIGSIQAAVMQLLTPEQAATAAAFFVIISQIGSILRLVLDQLKPETATQPETVTVKEEDGGC